MHAANYTIGRLAKATDTKAVTIRYYEQLGLLPSAGRTPSGYRIYTGAEHNRLLFIRRARALGFTLDDVRELLGLADQRHAPCAAVDAKVSEQLKHVRARIDDLVALEAELQRLITGCQGGVIGQCRVIETLTSRS